MAIAAQIVVFAVLFVITRATSSQKSTTQASQQYSKQQDELTPTLASQKPSAFFHSLQKRSFEQSPWNLPIDNTYTRHSYYPSSTSDIMPLDSSDQEFYSDFSGLKRSVPLYSFHDPYSYEGKRSPSEVGARGFHEGIFTHHFGDFSPVKRSKRSLSASQQKRRPEMDSSGFYGDTFSNGFGDFYVMKKEQMKKRKPEWDSSGFDGDLFTGGFGAFYPMRKKSMEMDSSGFFGDTFSGGFGDFHTMRKRLPEMTSSGFHGDTFSNGFGDFYTMKRAENPSRPIRRRKRELRSNKRGPEMTASGFYGDTFSNGFGDFYTMKRSPEMTSSGFHGDTFSNGFGDFYTMRKKYIQQKKLLDLLQHLNERLSESQKEKEMVPLSR